MFRAKYLRIGLLIIILGTAVLIAWSVVSRTSDPVSRDETLLGAELQRETTEFEYIELKRGREVFRVEAERTTVDKQGVQQLEKVRMMRIGLEGKAADSIEAAGARYLPEEKRIAFEEDVVIQLENGAHIFAANVRVDLAGEVLYIDEEFRFSRGPWMGKGKALVYRFAEKIMLVSEQFRLQLETSSPVALRSETARYKIQENWLELRDSARVKGRDRNLQASRIEIQMTSDQSLDEIQAVGDARLEAGNGRIFAGPRMIFWFDVSQPGRLDRFDVEGKKDGNRPGDLARFLERSSTRSLDLFSRKISVGVSEDAQGIRELKASQDVQMNSDSMGIEESHAETLRAFFHQATQALRTLTLDGRVYLARVSEDSSSKETLHCDTLTLHVSPAGRLEQAWATEDVELDSLGKMSHRRLSADRKVHVLFKDGLMQSVHSLGDSRLESRTGDRRFVLLAPEIRGHFKQAILQRVEAGEGVDLELTSRQATQHTRSRTLTLFYRNGKPVRALQEGDFHLLDTGEDSQAELISDRAEYEFESEQLHASGSVPVVLKVRFPAEDEASVQDFETTAEEMLLEREDRSVVATGQVQSLFRGEGEPLLVTAGRMRMNEDQIVYFDSPRIVQGPHTIRGGEVHFFRQSERLWIEQGVESILTDEARGDYQVTSSTLEVEMEQGQALYEGNVVVQGTDLEMQAPRVILKFESKDMAELEEIVASGGVRILEKGRRWTAERAIYNQREDRVIVGENVTSVAELR